jgi:anti-sigma B factor antagonist
MLHAFETRTRTEPDGTAVLSVLGELDIASAPQFREAVGALMGTGVRHLVVDLSGSDFVDSSGIGAVLWAEHRLQAAGGDLRTQGCTDGVTRAFQLAGLGELAH